MKFCINCSIEATVRENPEMLGGKIGHEIREISGILKIGQRKKINYT